MARPRKVGKKTTIGIDEDLVGWIEFRGRAYSRGFAGYLNDLARHDREAALAEGGELVDRYRAYLRAIDREGELEPTSGKEG